MAVGVSACLLELRHGSPHPQAGTYTIGTLASQAFGSGWNIYHLLSWVSSWQTADRGTSQPP